MFTRLFGLFCILIFSISMVMLFTYENKNTGIIFLGFVFMFIFWVMMLIDLFRKNITTQQRVFWGLIIVLGNFLGATVYFFAFWKWKSEST